MLNPTHILAVVALAAGTGPAAGQASWSSPIAFTTNSQTAFTPAMLSSISSRSLGNASLRAGTMQRVELTDERPFGDKSQKSAWLVHFDSVPIRVGNSTTTISLSLAFDVITNDLVCAFTEASPAGLHSTFPPGFIESQIAQCGFEMSPAKYPDLHSTVLAVLGAVCEGFGVDPGRAGQIVVRPRFVANHTIVQEVDGKRIPAYTPSNVWIVEILGTDVMFPQPGKEDRRMTTLIAQVRDGDLATMPSLLLP